MTLAVLDARQGPLAILSFGESTVEASRQAGIAVSAAEDAVSEVAKINGIVEGTDTGSAILRILDDYGFLIKEASTQRESIPGATVQVDDENTFAVLDQFGFLGFRISTTGGFQSGSLFTASSNDEVAPSIPWVTCTGDSGFGVATDFTGTPTTAELEVSVNGDFSTRRFISPPASIYRTDKNTSDDYRSALLTADGLRPDTSYFWRIVVDGIPGDAYTITTTPRELVPSDFSFVFGSCRDDTTDYPAIRAAANEAGALFCLFIGDLTYADIVSDNIRGARDRYARAFRRDEDGAYLAARMPIIYMPENHDMGDPDTHWDHPYADGRIHQEVTGNARKAWFETVNTDLLEMADADRRVLSFAFTVANTRFVVLDTTSQKRFKRINYTTIAEMNADTSQLVGRITGNDEGGTYRWDGDTWNLVLSADYPDSILGRGFDGMFDQMQWLKDQLVAAEAAGFERVYIATPDSWTAGGGGWGSYFTGERQEVCDFIAGNTTMPVTILTGDLHYSGVDDGALVDYSTGGVLSNRLTMAQSSGFHVRTGNVGTDTAITWNGAASKFLDNLQTYIRVDHESGGETSYIVKGSPFTGDTPTVLGTYNTSDL